MFRRIPQPPVNPAARDAERRGFRPGFLAALAGVGLAFLGASHLTRVEAVQGGMARETQLMRGFSSGGLQFAGDFSAPPPPRLDGAANAAEALDQWAKQSANFKRPAWKVRVDTRATTPCPT
jgi:hypothetical protein